MTTMTSLPTDLTDLIEAHAEGELHASAMREVLESVAPMLENDSKYREHRIFERLIVAERVVRVKVEWVDDEGVGRVNRAWRVEHCGALGPYKGGLRFHPSVCMDVLSFLAYEQSFKNALTGLPMGGAKGGSDFSPKGKSEGEVMRFCQAFARALGGEFGPRTDVPAGDIGVGGREVGYIAGTLRKMTNRFEGTLTGKPEALGGLNGREEATGYGLITFVRAMLDHAGKDLDGKRVAISGSGNVALFAAERAAREGGTVVCVSDSNGLLVKDDGFTEPDIKALKELKFVKRGRLHEAGLSGTDYRDGKEPWNEVSCDVALPCATQHEIDESEAKAIAEHGAMLVAEGANMPCTHGARKVFAERGVRFAPGKAANAGGVATSLFEMSQNATFVPWTLERTIDTLDETMRAIHERCVRHGTNGDAIDYGRGADAAGFERLADAMIRSGV
ncbi:MAG: NADP-specific glutamate dehydrogenase [Phycisphaerales bacterium]